MEFEKYLSTYGDRLKQFAVVVCDDPSIAEDVLQEVLARAFKAWSSISQLDRPHAYVRKMIVNEALSWRRKWGRIEARAHVTLESNSVDESGGRDNRAELVAAISSLPARQRTAVVLRYFEDLDDADIAAAMGCRETTVRGYIHRALKSLRVEIVGGRTDRTTSHSAERSWRAYRI